MVDQPGRESAPVEQLEALAALGEPTRRALYRYVVDHGGWVSREQAADATGIQRTLAAHHLDRLAADGLLEVDYQRSTGRRGPGAGRPAKLYRRAARQFEVSLPPRRYELAARLLADAVETVTLDDVPLARALDQVARRAGQALATDVRLALPRRAGTAPTRDAIGAELRRCGYEPETISGGATTLRNCPFHELAQRHVELVCGLNLSLLDGLVGELPAARLTARLEPGEGRCCVVLRPTT